MGEAKRKREAVKTRPCICGSGKVAGQCCLDGQAWHKAPAKLGLKEMPAGSAVGKCYMRDLGSCGGGISREHLISESVMRLLQKDGDFSISGLPWQPAGEERVFAVGNLTAKCLCRDHNSALSQLDTAALRFFAALRSCLEQEADSVHFIVSGHDIERWLLKTIVALAVSGNLGRGHERLPGLFARGIDVLQMLDDHTAWPDGAGLYFAMLTGDTTVNHPRLQITPYTNGQDEIWGVGTMILGLHFRLLLQAPDSATAGIWQGSTFRAGEIRVSFGTSRNRIAICWDDGRPHPEFVRLSFLNNVDG